MRGTRQALLTVFALACCYALVLLALNAGLGRWLLEAYVNRAQPALGRSFRCTGVTVTPTLRVHLSGLRARWVHERQAYDVSVGSLQLHTSLLRAWLTQCLAFTMMDAAASGRDLMVEGATFHFDGALPGHASAAMRPIGHFAVRRVRAGQLAVTQLEGSIVQHGNRYAIDPLTMRAYGGALRGTLTAEAGAAPRAALTLHASRLQLGELAPLNADVFRGSHGSLEGTLQVAGDRSGVTTLRGDCTVAAPGGRLGASFLRALLPYLPKSLERQRLEAAMARGELVPFESASLAVMIVEPAHVKMVLNMAIPEYNLVLDHITLDVRVESPQLLSQLAQFLGTLH